MGRKVRRVPLDFDWPLDEVWEGFTGPASRPCPSADCYHGSTMAGRWLECAVHLIMLIGEAGVSDRPLHPWLREMPLNPGVRPGPDAAELTAGFAERGPGFMGHDAIDRWKAQRKIVAAAGLPESWGTCPACKGHGIHPDDFAASDAWQPTEPPDGEGWQLWETVSEGSPISPVFTSAEELAAWMSEPERGRDWLTPEAAAKFVDVGWAPSMVGSPGRGVVCGPEWVGTTGER